MAKKDQLEWMMWRVDKSQRDDPPLVNLVRAIQHYNEKYGRIPNRCELANDWGKGLVPPMGMHLTRSRSVRPGHLMLATDASIDTALPGK